MSSLRAKLPADEVATALELALGEAGTPRGAHGIDFDGFLNLLKVRGWGGGGWVGGGWAWQPCVAWCAPPPPPLAHMRACVRTCTYVCARMHACASTTTTKRSAHLCNQPTNSPTTQPTALAGGQPGQPGHV